MITDDTLSSIAAAIATVTETVVIALAGFNLDTTRGTLVAATSIVAVITAYLGILALLETGWLDPVTGRHRPAAVRLEAGLYQAHNQQPGTVYRSTNFTALGETT